MYVSSGFLIGNMILPIGAVHLHPPRSTGGTYLGQGGDPLFTVPSGLQTDNGTRTSGRIIEAPERVQGIHNDNVIITIQLDTIRRQRNKYVTVLQ